MTTRQQLYVCAPCKSQQFHDVTGKAPARHCSTCSAIMATCKPTQGARVIKTFHNELAAERERTRIAAEAAE